MQLVMQDQDFQNPTLIAAAITLLATVGGVEVAPMLHARGETPQPAGALTERRPNDITVSASTPNAADVFMKPSTPEVPDVPLAPTPPAPSTAGAAPSTTAPAAPPASSPPLPPASAPAAPPAAAGAKRDVHGRVWDERIHSSTRAQNKDGSWRYRKNVAEDLIRTVEAQLDGATPAPPVATAPEPPAAPAMPPAAPAPAVDLGYVMQTVMGGLGAGRYTQARLGEVLQGLGIPTLQDLPKRPDQYRPFLEALGETLPA